MIAPKKDALEQPVRIALDWRAYFYKFCEAHGQHPVISDGYLLFPDGWRYSSTDYQGPEIAPPESKLELAKLQKLYWEGRKAVVREKIVELAASVAWIKAQQHARSAPLQRTVGYRSEEGQFKLEAIDVNLEELEHRLLWLRRDSAECDARLAEFGAGEVR